MYRASIENRGDARFHATTKDAVLVLGTDGGGVNPGDALLAGVCSCVAHYVKTHLEHERLAFASFTVDAEATPTADKRKLETVVLWLDLGPLELDDAGRAAVLAAGEQCRLLQTLKGGCQVELRWGRGPRRLASPARAGAPASTVA